MLKKKRGNCPFFGTELLVRWGQQKKGVLMMKKNPLTNHPLLMLLLAVLYFPIGVIMALAKNYK